MVDGDRLIEVLKRLLRKCVQVEFEAFNFEFESSVTCIGDDVDALLSLAISLSVFVI